MPHAENNPRLQLAPNPTVTHHVDGAWWPHSRRLTDELPELITESLTDYESLALRLTIDQGLLSSLRQRLVANRDSCALFDTPRFRDHLEAAYQIMWDRHCAGLKPEHFAVPAISPG